ncbi:MAG: type II toxin-antitoxin system VapC family toxin [Planctomycetaceae bacterium]
MMIGLDTNVLVRYLTRDDEAQYRATMKLLTRKAARFFVADLVLVETDWVLSSLYNWTRDETADAFARLLQVHNLQFEDEDRIRHSLAAVRRGADLSDELLLTMSRNQGCREFATFDTAIAKRHTKFAFVPKG